MQQTLLLVVAQQPLADAGPAGKGSDAHVTATTQTRFDSHTDVKL